MKLLLTSTGLLLALMLAYAAGSDFTTPMIADQPVVIVHIHSDKKTENADTVVIVENRSSQIVKDVWLVLAGHSCNSKPVWPLSRYSDDDGKKTNVGRPQIGPGGRAQIRFTSGLVRNVELSSEKSCGKKLPSELTVTQVDFSDGSSWTLGDVIRRGQQPIE